MFIIGGIQKTTLVDFPEKIAAIVFTQGCNFRCGYCHNPEILDFKQKGNYKTKEFIEFLKSRKGKLDGVVITGGEPTLQSGLYGFIKDIKSLNFAVKLDTNGTNPEILEKLIKENLLDYIAMDIKAPAEKYNKITCTNCNLQNIKQSIKLIMNSNTDYEFRTTVLKSQLSFEDFEDIGKMINGAKKYYLQKFVPSKILNNNLLNEKTYSEDEFNEICKNLKKYIKNIYVR